METLFHAAGITRQTFHAWLRPSERELSQTPEETVLFMAASIRKQYLPGSSAREIYRFIRKHHPQYNAMLIGWGKHRFEALCLGKGFKVENKPSVLKTTVRGAFMFANRIQGLKLTGTNQVWVSDICYLFGSQGKLIGYATSLIDVYSRRLLGLSFSKTMHAAVTSQEVLRQALHERAGAQLNGLFLHSDGGKQYIEKTFIAQLRQYGIESSMAQSCYENAFAETFNDILKNHMLADLSINSFPQLKKMESFIKNCYNRYRPHSSLQRMTPLAFEKHLLTVHLCQRTSLEIKVIEPKQTQNINHLSINRAYF
jgi:hypothetical protein